MVQVQANSQEIRVRPPQRDGGTSGPSIVMDGNKLSAHYIPGIGRLKTPLNSPDREPARYPLTQPTDQDPVLAQSEVPVATTLKLHPDASATEVETTICSQVGSTVSVLGELFKALGPEARAALREFHQEQLARKAA